MEKTLQLAALFSEMAVLLELSGENPFKVRAYENGARILETSTVPLEQFLKEPPAGFGKGLLEKVAEFLKHYHIADLETLRDKFPASLFELLKVQGLGPKKARILFQDLGITSLEELEAACHENKLLTHKGFGQKTQEKFLAGIQTLKSFQGQFLYPQALAISQFFMDDLSKAFPKLSIHVAGSLRRKKELVKDIDLLIASDGPAPIMRRFLEHPRVHQILMEGETKSSIIALEGIQVDLRVVPPESLGPALCHFTGSKEHNTRMRSRAVAAGKKFNEYGLYTGDACEPMATEEEVFAALGLPFIPPELREDLGEIGWAEKGRLPQLIEAKDIRGIAHAHTLASDGRATLEVMAETAIHHGWSWLGITDHSRSAHYAGGLSIDAVRQQWQLIDAWNAANPGFRLLKGIESDILADGSLDYPADLLAGFDFIIASVHAHLTMTADEMTARIIKAVENPFTTVLGHPSGRLLLEREAYSCNMDAIIEACLKQGVVIEINCNPHRMDIDWRYLRKYHGKGLKCLISPDAHTPEGLHDIGLGVNIARKGALEKKNLLNCLSADAFVAFAQSRRTS